MKKFCYTIIEGQMDGGQYVPSAIYEGEVGHHPLTGKEDQVAWHWGDTRKKAQEVCDHQNALIGFTKKQALKWQGYSMFGWPKNESFDF